MLNRMTLAAVAALFAVSSLPTHAETPAAPSAKPHRVRATPPVEVHPSHGSPGVVQTNANARAIIIVGGRVRQPRAEISRPSGAASLNPQPLPPDPPPLRQKR